eukprot:CAMPEP_0206130616 /NCGR_PEP_ID=MMETSP1472-20131121/41834_1 /ASSEMBLY_ACC=CAM_ASM_001108 /TAXON_ID=41880 /ORGANISM="Pycnococcus provasolii, Strain RCC251" /LENGTH=172 /DNA_ID=CAMNT_0053521981 /DNA_START=128 /DNA_END=646 /DNA_ORIENTATION=+
MSTWRFVLVLECKVHLPLLWMVPLSLEARVQDVLVAQVLALAHRHGNKAPLSKFRVVDFKLLLDARLHACNLLMRRDGEKEGIAEIVEWLAAELALRRGCSAGARRRSVIRSLILGCSRRAGGVATLIRVCLKMVHVDHHASHVLQNVLLLLRDLLRSKAPVLIVDLPNLFC